MLTHGDIDHVGGAGAAIDEYSPALLVATPAGTTSPAWREAIALAADRGIPVRRPSAGEVFDLGRGHSLHVLYPPAESGPGFVADDRNLVLQLRLANGARLLFTGDSGFYTERWLLEHSPPDSLRSDVLIKGHHDGDLSGLPEFIDAVDPRATVIGRRARPSSADGEPTLAARLRARGIGVFDQSESGAVQILAGGGATTILGFLDHVELALESPGE